jgi:hypothetical protein
VKNSGRAASAIKSIAESRNGDDHVWILGGLLQFLPQAGYVNIDGACEGTRLVAPNFAQQLGKVLCLDAE